MMLIRGPTNNNNNIFLPSQLAYSKNYLIKQITNMYLEL